MRRSLMGVAALAVAVIACSRQPKEYVIGAAGPQKLSYGVLNQEGIDLAIEEVNRAGGINGVPIRLVVRDDGGSGVDAARVAGELVADKNVLAVVGHAGSGAMVAAARVYDAGHLPALATTPSSPDLTGVSPWAFRMISSDSVNGLELARFASSFTDSLGRPVRAAILYANDAYGRGLSEAFQRNFRGVFVTADPVGTDTQYEPYVAFLKARKVDLVFFASEPEVGIPFLREARRQQLGAVFLGGDGWQGVADDASSDGVYVGAPFTAQSPDTAVRRFVAAFRAKFHKDPEAHAALAYDATKLVARAIAGAGPDREAIRRYLAGLTPATAFRGVTGMTRFQPNNDPATEHFVIARVQRGALVPVADYR